MRYGIPLAANYSTKRQIFGALSHTEIKLENIVKSEWLAS